MLWQTSEGASSTLSTKSPLSSFRTAHSTTAFWSLVGFLSTACDPHGPVCMSCYLHLWFLNLDVLIVKDLHRWPDFPNWWKLTLISAAVAAYGFEITHPLRYRNHPSLLDHRYLWALELTWHLSACRWFVLFASGLKLVLKVLTQTLLSPSVYNPDLGPLYCVNLGHRIIES